MDILRWEERRTRKPHRCFGCRKAYPAGTKMISAAYADGGVAWSSYWCDTCIEVIDRYGERGDEYCAGDALNFDEWNAVYAEIHPEKSVTA